MSSPDRTVVDDLVSALGAVLRPHSGIYASAPITGGARLFAVRSELHRNRDEETPDKLARGVVEPNIAEARALAASLRSRFGFKVIDPSWLVAGEWTQSHYTALWAAVIRRYASLVVFADGWELSSGCTAEFVVATSLGIETVDSRLQPLSREAGIARIAAAVANWHSASALPAFLRERLDELDGRGSEDRAADVSDAPCEDRVALCTEMLGTVAAAGDSDFVCSPSADERRTNSLRRQTRRAVIDPWGFQPAHWPRSEQSRLWVTALERYASRVLVDEGCRSASECRNLLATAERIGIPFAGIGDGEPTRVAN